MSETWVDELIQKQVEHQIDENLGKLYLEKETSLKQKNSVSASGRYKGRPDAGTRGNVHGHENRWNKDSVYPGSDSPSHDANFKKKKDNAALVEELRQVSSRNNPTPEEKNWITENEEGDWMSEEFTDLSRGDTAHIGPGTEFSDGSYIDSEGDLRSPDRLGISTRDDEGNQLTDAEIEKLQKEAFENELARKNAEKKWEREQDRKTRGFVAGQTYNGKRLGKQNARKM